jgi:imidazole glycerol-phosphate synthase subunit HisH
MGGIVLVDYGSGNLRSAAKALERAAAEAPGRPEVVVSSDPEAVLSADRIVLPGQGAFADCLNGLQAVEGMREALEEAVRKKGRPFLGICVGMQLMATRGLEHEERAGLDWIGGEIVRIEPADPTLKVPHMGWNDLHLHQPHPVFAGLDQGAHAYWVHSYHFVPKAESDLLVSCDYGGRVVGAVGRDNMVGTQFHPEKSQATGLRLIANFLGWAP